MAGVFLFLLSVCLSLPAQASVRTISESGRPIYWPNPNIYFYGNPANASGLDSPTVRTMLNAAFTSWMNSDNRVQTHYSQSAGYAARSEYDGINSVYFASHAGRTLDERVVALTEVLYFVNSGQIAEADMVFNDNDFIFTNQEGDTGLDDGHGGSLIYLQDVATHEAGHALGLDHSNVNLSSLFYTAFSGQYALSDDDKNILSTIYPSSSANGGTLTGTVRGANAGIFGTQVSAINLATGKIQAAALTNPDGSFRLANLPDAPYSIFMEPFLTSTDTISSYFSNLDHRFCPSTAHFERGFYGPCGATKTAVVQISGGNTVDLKTLAPSCSLIPSRAANNNPLLAPYEIPATGAVHGILERSQSHTYLIRNVTGALKARALSYSLFSPYDVRVEFLDPALGTALPGASSTDNVQNPKPGGGPNYDGQATYTANNEDVLVRVRMNPSAINPTNYPGGYELVDWSGYYLLSLSVGTDFGAEPPVDMASCASVPNVQQDAHFKNAPSSSPSKGGGCGTLGGPGAGGDGPGSGLTLLFASAFLLQGYFWAKRNPRFRLKLVRRRR